MRAPAALVGIDLGTTACRATVFDERLGVLAAAVRPLAIERRSGAEIEQDAEAWWQATADTVSEALAGCPGAAARVRGIGVSSQGISIVPVDAGGAPLRPALSWLDTRAVDGRRAVAETLGERRVFEITGKRCSEAYVLPKLLWLREHEPDIWRRTRRVLMPLDFLLARLTGEAVTDHTMASGTLLFDVTRREWSAPILEAFDLDPDILPPARPAIECAGELRRAAADGLGLPPHVPVAVGGQDQKVAALGAGLDHDRCTISLGTAMAITRSSAHPLLDPGMRVPCFADLRPERWVLEGSAVCGSILDWAKATLLPSAGWDELNALIGDETEASPGPLALPFFSGAPAPFFDPDARGTIDGLDLSTTPGAIVRAICESIAYLVRTNLEVMERLAPPVRSLRIFGGGSRSDAWCRIIADVVQRPVTAMASAEAASVGAAILAGLAGGIFAGVEDAFAHLVERTSYDPRPGRARRHDDGYARFVDLASRATSRDGRTT